MKVEGMLQCVSSWTKMEDEVYERCRLPKRLCIPRLLKSLGWLDTQCLIALTVSGSST